MTPMRFYATVAVVAIIGMFVAIRANADDAARGWSNSMSYSSPSQQSVDFNKAQQELLARKGLLGNHVTNNDYSTTTTNCKAAGACQHGGTATNVNGYSSIKVEDSDGATIGVDIDAEAKQDATPVVAKDVGNIVID